MKLNKSILLIPILLVLVFFLIGCLPVPVTGVTILQDDFFQIVLGGTPFQLTIEIEPSNASDTGVTWTSSNTVSATVDGNGLVTAVEKGMAKITVTTNDGGFTDTVEIEVIELK